jgi:hypothetical protein
MLPDNQGETETGPGIAINIIHIGSAALHPQILDLEPQRVVLDGALLVNFGRAQIRDNGGQKEPITM